jgi:hypothetical protein
LGDQDLAGFRSDLLRRHCAAENPLYPAARGLTLEGRGLAFIAAPEELL